MTAGRKFTIPLGPQERTTAREIAEHWSDPQNVDANAHVLELLLRALDDIDDAEQRAIEAAAAACDALVSETGLSIAGMCADRVRDLHKNGFNARQVTARELLARQEQTIAELRKEIDRLNAMATSASSPHMRGVSMKSTIVDDPLKRLGGMCTPAQVEKNIRDLYGIKKP